MDYDRIILEMLNRIKALEDDVGALKKAGTINMPPTITEDSAPVVGKKYAKLSKYLSNSGMNQIKVSFDKIEELLETPLPDSARKHSAFWANTTTHSIALAWLSCNYKTVKVNTKMGVVVFERTQGTRISDYMEEFVNSIVEQNGVGYEMTAQEIRQRMKDLYGVNPSSVLPADYCYNRINYGIDPAKQPMFFEYVDGGRYRCLGSFYSYNGKVFCRPRGESTDVVVGFCKEGKRYIDEEHKTESIDYSSAILVSMNYLWKYGDEEDWKHALNHYYDLIPDANMALEKEMEKLQPETVEAMTDEEFYDFLYNKFFVWKYTRKNRLTTTRMGLEKYISENRLHELGEIKRQLFAADLNNTEECLAIVKQIHGLGINGAGSLLAILFPHQFGTIEEFVVTALLKTEVKNHSVMKQINPENIKITEAAILMDILRKKADELNSQFHSEYWTPRKLDMILWAIER